MRRLTIAVPAFVLLVSCSASPPEPNPDELVAAGKHVQLLSMATDPI